MEDRIKQDRIPDEAPESLDAFLGELADALSPEEKEEREIRPWRKAIGRIIWGIVLTIIELDYLMLNHILPVIGYMILILGTRALRCENRHFRNLHILTLVRAVRKLLLFAYYGSYFHELDGLLDIEEHPWIIAVLATDVLTMLFSLFAFSNGLSEAARKAGLEEEPKGSLLIIVWYLILLFMPMMGLGGPLVLLMIPVLVLLALNLCKNVKVLEKAGYVIAPAQQKWPDGAVAAVCVAAVVAMASLGVLFCGRLPMNWEIKQDYDYKEKALEAALDLKDLGFPYYVLKDLSSKDVLSCYGADYIDVVHQVFDADQTELTEQTEGSAEKFEEGTLVMTRVMVRFRFKTGHGEEQRWKVFVHYYWPGERKFYGSETIGILGMRSVDKSGRVIDSDFTELPYGRALYSFTQEDPSVSWVSDFYPTKNKYLFRGIYTDGLVPENRRYLSFSMPREKVYNARAYVAYTIYQTDNYFAYTRYMYDYISQQAWFTFPFITADDYAGSGSVFCIPGSFRHHTSELVQHAPAWQ